MMKEGKKMKVFLNKLGSLLRSLVQDIYLETVCAPKDDLVTCGAGIISIMRGEKYDSRRIP